MADDPKTMLHASSSKGASSYEGEWKGVFGWYPDIRDLQVGLEEVVDMGKVVYDDSGKAFEMSECPRTLAIQDIIHHFMVLGISNMDIKAAESNMLFTVVYQEDADAIREYFFKNSPLGLESYTAFDCVQNLKAPCYEEITIEDFALIREKRKATLNVTLNAFLADMQCVMQEIFAVPNGFLSPASEVPVVKREQLAPYEQAVVAAIALTTGFSVEQLTGNTQDADL